MKPVCAILSLIILVTACSKEHHNNNALLGVWVEKSRGLDTLHVYRSGNKFIMFDNSEHYRMSQAPTDQFFRHQIVLKKDSIAFRSANAAREEPFFYYFFEWIVFKKEFKMSYNGLRPYLSSIGFVTYVRVD